MTKINQWIVKTIGFFLTVVIFLFDVIQPARCANQIEEVCKEIEKTINQTIQNTLNTLEKDCQNISMLIDKKLQEDRLVSKIVELPVDRLEN